MKKRLGIFLMTVLLLVISTAEIEAKGLESVAQPCYEYVNDINAELVISNDGIAHVTARCVSSASNTEKITLHVYLQRYVNEEWINIKCWQVTSQTRTCTLNRSTTVTHGSSYRVMVSVYVMTSDDSEQVEIYTPSKWY